VAPAERRLSVVGAGIVGLLVAYVCRTRWPRHGIEVFDHGPNPRTQPMAKVNSGATWSGLDARHVSLTETAPWTSASRARLIERPVSLGGWNCLTDSVLSEREHRWLREFKSLTASPESHDANSRSVVALNTAGLEAWTQLSTDHPDLFRPISSWGRLPIVCTRRDELFSEHTAEVALDPAHVTDPVQSLPPELAQLEGQLEAGILCGSFLVRGNAYQVRTLCSGLIEWLEANDVRFHWNQPVDLTGTGQLPLPEGDVVWAAGVSKGAAQLLSRLDILLQGVMGCWIALPNPGYIHPFKVLANEPVNFINCTPVASKVLLSGGYGWVGERSYDEAERLAVPLARSFASEVTRLFGVDNIREFDAYESAICIRPSLPSGVSEVKMVGEVDGHRLLICVGHAAGGFTQSPAVADRIVDLLEQ
jgi:hypothetical protein